VSADFQGAPLRQPRFGLGCKFGTQVVTAWLGRPGLVECQAPAHTAGFVRVELALNNDTVGLSSLADTAALLYRMPASTGAVLPTSGVSGSLVSVVGAGFAPGAMCVFDGVAVPATFESTTLARCLVPSELPVGSVQVTLANEGDQAVGLPTAVEFTVLTLPHVSAATPLAGPSAGGTRVHVSGASLDFSGGRCCFGAVCVGTSQGAATVGVQLDCISPASDAGGGQTALRVDLEDSIAVEADRGIRFLYLRATFIQAVMPPDVSAAGIAALRLYTDNAVPSSLACALGSGPPGAGSFLTGGILCSCLPGDIGFTLLRVDSVDEVHWTATALVQIVTPPVIRPVAASSEPLWGGTLLFASGIDATPDTRCRFGDIVALTTFVSSALVVCEQPALVAGQTTVDFVLRGSDNSVNGVALFRAEFTVGRPASAVALEPISGLDAGGTSITLLGDMSEDALDVLCRLGTTDVIGTILSTTVAICVSTAHIAGIVTVQLNSRSQLAPMVWLPFSVDAPTTLFRVVPAAFGQLLVHGAGMPVHDGVMCALDGTATAAAVVSPLLLECALPAAWFGALGYVELRLLQKKSLLASSQLYVEYAAPSWQPVIQRVFPVSASAAFGGTLVTIRGSSFRTGILCVFSGMRDSRPASMVSTALVVCETPVATVGTLLLGLTGDTSIGVDVAVSFAFEAPLLLADITPAYGVSAGGTAVRTAVNSDLDRDVLLFCGFGTVSHVATTWVAKDELTCVAPAHKAMVVPFHLGAMSNTVEWPQLDFTYFEMPTLQTVLPESVSAAAISQVAVLLLQLPPVPVFCSTKQVSALVKLPNGGLQCNVAPDGAGFFTMDISVAQTDPVARFQLTSIAQTLLLAADPIMGVAGFGTLRFISGSDLMPSMRCTHDAALDSVADVVSSALAVCEDSNLVLPVGQLSLISPAGRSNSVLYRSVAKPSLASLAPAFSNPLGTTTVSVTVVQPDTIIACRIGTFFPVEIAIAGAEIRCIAPAHAPGSVPVGLSPNRQDVNFLLGSVLTYQQPAIPSAVLPSYLATDGGISLSIVLETALLVGQHPQCSIGSALSAVESSHATPNPSIVCVAPPHYSGYTTLALQYSNDAATSAVLEIEYRLPGTAHSMQPTQVLPGTVVTVLTRDVAPSGACAFAPAPAWHAGTFVISSALIKCEASVLSTGAAVAATTSLVDLLSLGELLWSPVAVASVFSASPSWGAVDGGTPVLLACSSEQFMCRFATIGPITGRFDGGSLVCDSPAHAARPVVVTTALQQPLWTLRGPVFNYLTRATATAVVSTMPVTALGSTPIEIAADGVVPGAAPACFVGSASVVLSLLPSSPFTCHVAGLKPGFTVVSLGRPGGVSDGATDILVQVSPTTLHAFPAVIAAEGGTVISAIIGNGGYSGDGCAFDTVSIAGARVSSVLLLCEAVGGEAGAVLLLKAGLTAASSSSTAVELELQPALLVSGSMPGAGPETGGTVTTVTTAVQAVDSPMLACGFGTLFPVSAVWISSSMLQCTSPASYTSTTSAVVYPRAVPLFASANGADRITADVYFDIQPSAHVVAVTPRSGIHLGQTPVFIVGAGFINSTDLACRFGLVTVPATFLSFTNLLCVAPAQAPGPVFLEVTNNGLDFTTDRVLFFYGTCPLGSYCPDGEALACPRGAFCAGTSNFNFTLCPPGTFQTRSGQAACLPSPVGYFAPDFGMVAPRLCPRGSVCDVTGLAGGLPSCPSGHYCLEGTRTANFSDFRVSERPLPCPFGFFCGPGVTTSKSIANNASTPQPCAPGYLCEPGSVTPQGSGPCPTGFYCPAGQLIPCPPRTYCPNVGNTEPKPCLPGMYNDESGLSTCKQCPVGTVCPGFTRQLPEPCPPGYVCEQVGLPLPITLCPAGHFCLVNTLTKDPLAPLDEQQLLRALPSGFTLNVSNFRPFPCYPATFCLDGVGNSTTVEGDYFHPQPCNAGSYCEWATSDVTVAVAGSTTVSNPKLPCPGGSYCPQGTYIPIPAPRGSFASGTGNAQAALCLPGTYTHYEGFQNCLSCPSGYECRTDGTYKPTICGAGSYRSIRDSITCLSCPAGTWYPYRGLTDAAMCMPCQPGLVCGVDGMTNSKPYGTQGKLQITNAYIKICEASPKSAECIQIALQPLGQAVVCPEGYVCDAGTTIASAKCPDGYFCGLGTTPESQFANRCPAGYFCPAGTGSSTRTQFPCQACFYCPEGTGLISPRCPNGTQSVGGSKSINDCTADLITFWRVSPLRTALIQRTYSLQSGNATNSTSSNSTDASVMTNSSSTNSTSNSSLTGVPLALELLNSYTQCSPMSFDLLSPNFVTDPNDPNTIITDIEGQPLVYFQLPRNYVAKVRLDFRNISSDLVYGSHYEVAIFTGDYALQSTCSAADYQQVPCPPWNPGDGVNPATMGVIQSELNEIKCPRSTNGLELPFWFARNGLFGDSANNNVASPATGTFVDKRNMLELDIVANDDLQFRVEVRMLDGRYQSANRRSFLNTMCIDMVGPKRTAPTNSSFHIIYKQNLNYQLALNAPVQSQRQRSVVKNYLDCASTGGLTIDPTCRLLQPGVTLSFNSSFSSEYLLAQALLLADVAASNTSAANSTTTSTDTAAHNPLAGIPLVRPLAATSTTVPDVVALETNVLVDSNKFWSSGEDITAVDYLPFFSACRGFDAHVYLWQVLETRWTPNADLNVGYGAGCELYPPEETVFISQWAPQVFSAVADTCDVSFTCFIEESYTVNAAVSRWFESTGDTLFYITPEPQSPDELFAASAASTSTSIPPHDVGAYDAAIASQNLKAVSFKPAGTYTPGTVPKTVTFGMTYFPYTAENKRIVSAAVDMDGYQSSSTHNGQYTLNIQLTPLGWFQLLNAFAFDTLFYTVLFLGIGVISDFVLGMFWLGTRVFTRLRDPPSFKGTSMISLLAEQQVTGIFLAMVTFMVGELAVRTMYTQFTWLITFSGNIDAYLTSTADAITVSGRIGVTFIVMGLYGLWCGSALVAPDRPRDDTDALLNASAEEEEDEEFFTPTRWRRTHFIGTCLCQIVVELYLAEFSTVGTYNNYLFFCWFGMKWYHFIFEKISGMVLGDEFMVAAVGCISENNEGFVTIAAATFTEFALAYVLDCMYDAFEFLFLDVGIDSMFEYADATVKRLERLYYFVRKRTITQQLLHGGEEEEEEGTLEAVMETLASYAPKASSKLVLPFCLYLCWDFNAQLQYTSLWGIKRSDLLLYTLFLVVVVPFQWLQITYIFNAVEMFSGYQMYDYLRYAKYRFQSRTARWKGFEAHLDESIEPGLRAVDQMCFSNQMYFVVGLVGGFGTMTQFGILMLLRASYNPFGDILFLMIVALVALGCEVGRKIALRVADFANLWKLRRTAQFKDEKDSMFNPAELVLVPVRKRDERAPEVEQISGDWTSAEIASDAFKRAFLERNRMWILDQLGDAVTPRRTQRRALRVLSSDDDSVDDDAAMYGPVNLSPTSANVARQWAAAAIARAPGRQRRAAAIFTTDDEDEPKFPAVTLSQPAASMLSGWLGAARSVRRRAPPDMLSSSGETSSQTAENSADIPLQPESRAAALAWLSQARLRAAPRAPQTLASDTTSGHTSESSSDDAMMPANLSARARGVVLAWLYNARRSFAATDI